MEIEEITINYVYLFNLATNHTVDLLIITGPWRTCELILISIRTKISLSLSPLKLWLQLDV